MNRNDFDVIVIGGGITGAGIFNELASSGLKVCIVEKNDFGSGTSSKSSKLVHGGLRYLKEGNIMLTLESVHHRERLLKEAPGLVEPIEFIMPLYKNQSPGKLSLGAGLTIYDFMAMKIRHKFINTGSLLKKIPGLKKKRLKGAYSFTDATTDDSMLVARLVKEGIKNSNAHFLNYCEVIDILKDKMSDKQIARVKNEDGFIEEIKAKLVINAGGAWADRFHPLPGKKMRIRPLKGSHVVIKNDKFNLKSAVSFMHPHDKRPVFLIPWEGVILIGTTDIDAESMDDFKISKKEVEYLIEGAKSVFPDIKIEKGDIISSFSGIRPVISSGEKDPSKESREHLVWKNEGMISVTGGKLTTFRKLAWDTIKEGGKYLDTEKIINKKSHLFDFIPLVKDKKEKRILGRYGNVDLEKYKSKGLLKPIPGTETLYAELDIASNDETIKHLDDLMMRRLRLGIIMPDGGISIIDKVRELAGKNLGWNDEKWESEIKRYKDIYNQFFSPVI